MSQWKKLIYSGSNAHLNEVSASFFSGSGAGIFGIISSSYAVSSSYSAVAANILGPTGIYSGSGQVQRNTTVSASNVRFESNQNDDQYVAGFKFDSIYNPNNVITDQSGSLLFYSGKDRDNSRSYFKIGGEEEIINFSTIVSSSGKITELSIGSGEIDSFYQSGSDSYLFKLAGPRFLFTDNRVNPIGFEYAGNYTASIMNNVSSIVDVRTVRRLFSSASLFSSSIQVEYSLISNKPAGIVSSSAQISAFGFITSASILDLDAFTASIQSQTDSLKLTTGSLNTFTGSANLRLASIEVVTGSYATTGSNTFKANQTISGSLTMSGSILMVSGNFSGSHVGSGAGLTGLQKSIGLTIDGGGSVITTGIKGDIAIPFNGTITGWYLTADQAGSIVIDVWKDAIANFPPTVSDRIAGTEKPTLSGVAFNSDTSLTSFTGSISTGDVIRFNVDSVATITRANLVLTATTR